MPDGCQKPIAIYTLKLTLLQHQFNDISRHKKKKLEKMMFFSLVSNNISIEVQNSLAQKISTLPASYHYIQKPSLPVVTAKLFLPNYVGPRSTVLFSILGISHSFVGEHDCRQNPAYEQVKTAVKNLTPVNDSCERALALATKFNGSITKDEESYQELVLVVEDHCRKLKLENKSDLKNLYCV